MDIVWNISSDSKKNSFASVENDGVVFGIGFIGKLSPERKSVIKAVLKETVQLYAEKNKDGRH